MWPKLLDMTRDECRGMLRRLELESYSKVVGTFRAQGTLNDMKAKILKDLREAFHIPDERHKAEVRRVVNDEALSTVAKAVYGPNSEIGWNKEGSRGFTILPRSTPQTALSLYADKATKLGNNSNKELSPPEETRRNYAIGINDIKEEIVIKSTDSDTDTHEHKTVSSTPKPSLSKSAELCAVIKSSASRKRTAAKAAQMNNNPSFTTTKQNTYLSPKKLSSPPTNHLQSKHIPIRQRKSDLLATIRTSSDSIEYESECDAYNTNIRRISDKHLRQQINLNDLDRSILPIKIPKISVQQIPPTYKLNVQHIPPSPIEMKLSKTITKQTQQQQQLRLPPKINIISQQTITKNNVNYIPINENNKIIIKSDTKLSNALKMQKIQMIPAAKQSLSSPTTSTPSSIKNVSTNSQYKQQNALSSKVNYDSHEMYIVNLARQSANITIPAHETHTIEKVITDDTPIDVIPLNVAANRTNITNADDIIIEETTDCDLDDGNYENYEGKRYISTQNNAIPAKIVNYNNGTSNIAYNASEQQIVDDNVDATNIIYDENSNDNNWEYEIVQNNKEHTNGNSNEHTQHQYQDTNQFYTEEEVIEEEHVPEEYITNEVYAQNDNIIEMEIDSTN